MALQRVNSVPPHIAIDGPAASGKSTLGRALAGELGYLYLDTGEMYRAVTLAGIVGNISPDDGEALAVVASRLGFGVSADGLRINDHIATPELHSAQVDSCVSTVSSHPEVRTVLVARQQALARGERIVMVGRDIGTTVLPDAALKLWVTASAGERAKRRSVDRALGSSEDDVTKTAQTLADRDRRDSGRLHSPLQKASDAIVVDTGNRTRRQVLDKVLSLVLSQSSDSSSDQR